MKRSLYLMWLFAMIASVLLLVGSQVVAQPSRNTRSSDIFGDGGDGDLTVGTGQTVYVDNVRTAVVGTVTAGQASMSVESTTGFNIGDEVLIIQMRGNNAGTYEFGTISSFGATALTLQQNLQHQYNPPPEATLFELPNYSGRSESFTSDDACLTDNVIGDNVVSSLRVNSYVVHVFRECNFGGGGDFFVTDNPDLSAFQDLDNNISSLQVKPGAPGAAQVLRVPHYRNIVVQNGGLLTAHAWDGAIGGVLVFRASGTLDVQSGGAISMNGKGYVGGNGGPQPTQNPSEPTGDAGEGYLGRSVGTGNYPYDRKQGGGNGGGARLVNDSPPESNNGRAGGGGGGHGTSGQNGETRNKASGGTGGQPYGTSDLMTIYFGAGGGGGGGAQGYFGGQGGGIIFINVSEITVSGSITSNGQNGANGPNDNAGAGGGGAGGAILLRTQVGTLGANLVTASGGPGGASGGWNSGSGGQGGFGRIRIEYCDTLSGSTNPAASVQQLNCNTPPIANPEGPYNADEDSSLMITAPGVLSNDTDVDGDPLNALPESDPTHGLLTLNENGSFTYTPNANYNGPDSFTYKANDGQADSDPATVSINVTPVNDPPVSVDDPYNTDEDAPLNVAAPGVLGNDTDVDGDSLTAMLVSGSANGTLTLNEDGSFTYAPNPNFHGTDSFKYKAKDTSDALANEANVTIMVQPINDSPTCENTTLTTPEDIPSETSPVCSDVDGDPLTYNIVTQGTKGVASVISGKLHYQPNPNANGDDSFTYNARDGNLSSSDATVNVTITPVNDDPVANDDLATTGKNKEVTIVVLDNDIDADGDTLTITNVPPESIEGGRVTTDGTTVTFRPKGGFTGTDSFTYTISDGNGGGDTATVTITVTKK